VKEQNEERYQGRRGISDQGFRGGRGSGSWVEELENGPWGRNRIGKVGARGHQVLERKESKPNACTRNSSELSEKMRGVWKKKKKKGGASVKKEKNWDE